MKTYKNYLRNQKMRRELNVRKIKNGEAVTYWTDKGPSK
jgi:hypothetical protein